MSRQKLVITADTQLGIHLKQSNQNDYASINDDVIEATLKTEGLIVLKCLQSIKFDGSEDTPYITYQPEDAHLVEPFVHRILLYITKNDLLKSIVSNDIIPIKDWNVMVNAVHEQLKEKDKKKKSNYTDDNESNTLESVIKDQKPRISLGKDLEERLATYNNEISNGIIQNIVYTLNKVDEHLDWWTADKLNNAMVLGMSITDVPEETISNNEYTEAYTNLLRVVRKIKTDLKKEEEAKKIEKDVDLLLVLFANKRELFALWDTDVYDDSGNFCHKYKDVYIPKMIQHLKEEVIISKNAKILKLRASRILELLDMVPKFIEAYVHVFAGEPNVSFVSQSFTTKIVRQIVK